MRKQHNIENKHIQQSRDRYGSKLPKNTYNTMPVRRSEGVSAGDISQYVSQGRKDEEVATLNFTRGIVTYTSCYVNTITYYALLSEKDQTIHELARIAIEALPADYDKANRWDLLEKGMMREWERRQTKLYKALK